MTSTVTRTSNTLTTHALSLQHNGAMSAVRTHAQAPTVTHARWRIYLYG